MTSFSRIAIVIATALHLTCNIASAQSCYFPGGAVDNDSGVCEGSSVCCPLTWECIDNGLCYQAATKYFQRSSCTDDSWGDDCPQMCLKDDSGTENGNEAVQKCSDGRYCCDRNRPEVDEQDASKSCCAQKVRYIDIEDGTATATISSKASGPTKSSSSASSTTSSRGSSTSAVSTSTTSDPSSSTSQSTTSSSSSRPPQTSVITSESTTTNSADVATTVMIVTTAITTPTAAPAAAHEDSSNMGTIVGIAVGIPVGLAAAALLAFFYWRHRRNNKNAPTFDPPTSERKDLVDMYGSNTIHDGKPPEADGYPFASGTKPGHLSQAISEMFGSPVTHSQQYSSHSAVSPVTTKSFSNQSSTHNSNQPTANGLGFVPEEQPQELWGGEAPRQQQPQPQPQDFTPMGPRPVPYGGGSSYPGQPAPYQPASVQSPPYPAEAMQAARKSGEGPGAARSSGQYSAFQGVSELPETVRPVETAQSPPPGEDQGRIGQGLRVVNQ